MRTLEFKVDGLILSKIGDFGNLIAGTCGYLQAYFSFTSEWAGLAKVVTFKTTGGEFYAPLKNNRAEIPADALKYNTIAVTVEGRGKTCRLKTNGVQIVQSGGLN